MCVVWGNIQDSFPWAFTQVICVYQEFSLDRDAQLGIQPPITALFVNFDQNKLSDWSHYGGGEETKRGVNLLLIGQENLNVQNK